jgi:hypothetical protein
MQTAQRRFKHSNNSGPRGAASLALALAHETITSSRLAGLPEIDLGAGEGGLRLSCGAWLTARALVSWGASRHVVS